MTSTRPFQATTRTRPRARPVDGALHLSSDPHFYSSPMMTGDRPLVWAQDLDRAGILPDVVDHLFLGDIVDDGGAGQYPGAVAYLNKHFGAGRWHAALGNHDLWAGNPPESAATALGMPAANYVVDYDAYRLIVIAPEGLSGAPATTAMQDLTPARLQWINARLVETTKTCLIACHWSLYGTVGRLESGMGTRSIDAGFSATPDVDIRAMLADNANAKAWLSGHTHSPLESQGLVDPVTVGGHTLAAINCSSVGYPANQQVGGPIRSLYATITDNRIDVRFRDHGAGIWTVAGPERKAVWSVTF